MGDIIMATKVEFKKAKTCQHAYDVTINGGVWLKETCPCLQDKSITVFMLPTKDTMKRLNFEDKRPYTRAFHCDQCKHYKKESRKKEMGEKKTRNTSTKRKGKKKK